ncbi:MAG: hypothetical protein AAFN92_07640 [Bacteroidota bacterium]
MPNSSEDHRLGARLREHATPLDTEALWEAVETRLPAKRKRRLAPLWLWPLLGGGFLAWWLFQPGEKIQEEPTVVPVPEGEILAAAATEISSPALLPVTTPAQPRVDQRAVAIPVSVPEPLAEQGVDSPPLPTPELPPKRSAAAVPMIPALRWLPVVTPSPFTLPELPSPTTRPSTAVAEFTPRQRGHWSVEPGLTLSLPQRSITASTNAPQANLNERYSTALEGISAQGLVGYHLPGGLSLRSGFIHTRINSRLDVDDRHTELVPREAVFAIIRNPDGSSKEQTGTVQVEEVTVTKATYYNHVNSLDLPLLAGYQIGGNKWGLSLEGGPVLNVLSGGSARLYDGEGSFRTADGAHFRRRRPGVGWLVQASGSLRVSEAASLTAGLRWQELASDGFEKEAAGYATNYALVGLQVGYRITF